MANDVTKQLLEKLLASLYEQEAESINNSANEKSYLQAGDGQFLGTITTNKFDRDSLLNQYGSFGSKYSPTSIFNKYGSYGSRYGQWSVLNPHCASPPRLFINGKFLTHITCNSFIKPRIIFEDFEYLLKNDIKNLLKGQISPPNGLSVKSRSGCVVVGKNGTFLGKIVTNQMDPDSVFNTFGTYGSTYSPDSIFNQYGHFGGLYSDTSAFNAHATNPPAILSNGEEIGKLTKNSSFKDRVDPDDLKSWAKSNNL